jgi:galactose oxidase
MASLGNAWHIPTSAQPYRRGGMRDPVGAVVPGIAIEIFVGNQFQGPLHGAEGTAGALLDMKGTAVHFRYRRGSKWTTWQPTPVKFVSRGQTNGECDTTGRCLSTTKQHGNCVIEDSGAPTTQDSEYFVATFAADMFHAGDVVEYCICVRYQDAKHAKTWVLADGDESCTAAKEHDAHQQPFTFTVEPNAKYGLWSEVFELRNTAVHAHVLPNGKVLTWGRRDRPTQTINTHECTPYVWDPHKRGTPEAYKTTPQPMLANGKTTVNMFCSGHTFLPDGRLLVVGGHLFDGEGLQQGSIYDLEKNTWTATSLMNDGRWYPTATTLPDGDVLVLSGSVSNGDSMNPVPQVWRDGTWIDLHPPGWPTLSLIQAFELYPRIHVLSSGKLCMTGSLQGTWLLDISKNDGTWTRIAGRGRINGRRDYCPSVMYDRDKIIYIGGGNAPENEGYVPTAAAEIIDLGPGAPLDPGQRGPRWAETDSMTFPRRHHNATILPDGTVLVTGGSRGGRGPGNGFNDLTRGAPVHIPELWDPATGKWTQLAAEQVDRCYHATAVLLPDATVLSAGSGEYAPWQGSGEENFPEDNHRNGQIFSPPYLFKPHETRPVISQAPPLVTYGGTYTVKTEQADDIAKVSLVRLSSVTHAFNMNQLINFPAFVHGDGELLVTAPDSRNESPPGHYMLFIISKTGFPSVAKILRLGPAYAARDIVAAGTSDDTLSASPPADDATFLTSVERSAAVDDAADGTKVVVGLTGRCPYGIGACWGGAEEALRALEGVRYVDPIPNVGGSTANVFLKDDRLPPLAVWEVEFPRVANGSYDLRGVEISLTGEIETRDGELFLATGKDSVRLAALAPEEKILWDAAALAPQALKVSEASAYDDLAAESGLAGGGQASVTGSLEELADGYVLHVRRFSVATLAG